MLNALLWGAVRDYNLDGASIVFGMKRVGRRAVQPVPAALAALRSL